MFDACQLFAATPYFHEYFLDDFLGEERGAGDGTGEGVDEGVIVVEEKMKRAFVTRCDAGDQFFFGARG